MNAFPSSKGKQIFVNVTLILSNLDMILTFSISVKCEIKYNTDWHDWKYHVSAHADDNIAKTDIGMILYRILLVFKFWSNFAEHFNNYINS